MAGLRFIDMSFICDYNGHIEMCKEVIIMKTAAVSELKALLSKYLSQVKAGEEVVITDRGKPIAKIVPIARADTEIPAHLLTLERAGLARIGRNSLPKGFWALPRPKDRKGRALQSLLQEREEGR
jgi:prevent-host-death family protein